MECLPQILHIAAVDQHRLLIRSILQTRGSNLTADVQDVHLGRFVGGGLDKRAGIGDEKWGGGG